MAKIVIYNLDERSISIESTTRPLLWHLQEHRIDWMHACGGKGRCTTCKVEIVGDQSHAGPLTQPEMKYRSSGGLSANERLACQMTVHGDLTVRVPDETKLPHIRYSDDSIDLPEKSVF